MKTNNSIDLTEQVVLQFLDTASALERSLDRVLSSIRGVSFSEYLLLKTLAAVNPAGTPKIDLANAVGLTASAVTRALKPLEKTGYVNTRRSERDARQSLVTITPAGTQLLEDARAVLQDSVRGLPLHEQSPQRLAAFQSRLTDLKRR